MKINNIAELKTRKGTSNANVEVLGYYTSGDGGGGSFYWDNTSTETDNGGTIIQVTGVTTGRWKRIHDKLLFVEEFGAKGDDIQDDTLFIKSAITYLNNIGGTLCFKDKNYKITDNLSIDLSNVCIIGDKTLLNCESLPANTYALSLYSSVVANNDKWNKNVGSNFSDITVYRGTYLLNSKGVSYGSNTHANNNDIKIKGLTIFGFDTGLEFLENSWRVYFDSCSFVSNSASDTYLLKFNALSNSGEAMYFSHCAFLGNGKKVLLNQGYWNFNSCSFLHANIECKGSFGNGKFSSCNFESLDNVNYLMLEVHENFYATVDSCSLIVNSGGLTTNAWTSSPFNCDTLTGGLKITNSFLQQGTAFAFYNQSSNEGNELINGNGRIIQSDNHTFSNLGSFRNCLFSKQCSPIYNGNAETGNTNGWVFTTYGTPDATMVADTISKKTGTYGFHLTSTLGGANAVQWVEVSPNQLVLLQAFSKNITAGTGGYFQFSFYDITKTFQIGATLGDNIDSTSWKYLQASGIAPVGACFVKINVNIQPASEYYIDNIIMNIL